MSKSVVLSTRLASQQEKRLQRKARQLGRTLSEAGALLIEEGLRRDEFAFIDFRDSPVGRQAYVQGSTLAVWEVVWLARGYGNSAKKTAEHLKMSLLKVRAALNYANAYPAEIETAIADHEAANFTTLPHLLPGVEELVLPKAK
ncbi:MAG TPA: hypothetical protein VMD30_08005 [Tepidisphaeraceae bacterium]|nr:hypothetical protein [Tepidisphaeraceae bacterium]